MSRFLDRYVEIRDHLREDLENGNTASQTHGRRDDRIVMQNLYVLMLEMETRDATEEEINFALNNCGTWLDDNYWRMYCRNVGWMWKEITRAP